MRSLDVIQGSLAKDAWKGCYVEEKRRDIGGARRAKDVVKANNPSAALTRILLDG